MDGAMITLLMCLGCYMLGFICAGIVLSLVRFADDDD